MVFRPATHEGAGERSTLVEVKGLDRSRLHECFLCAPQGCMYVASTTSSHHHFHTSYAPASAAHTGSPGPRSSQGLAPPPQVSPGPEGRLMDELEDDLNASDDESAWEQIKHYMRIHRSPWGPRPAGPAAQARTASGAAAAAGSPGKQGVAAFNERAAAAGAAAATTAGPGASRKGANSGGGRSRGGSAGRSVGRQAVASFEDEEVEWVRKSEPELEHELGKGRHGSASPAPSSTQASPGSRARLAPLHAPEGAGTDATSAGSRISRALRALHVPPDRAAGVAGIGAVAPAASDTQPIQGTPVLAHALSTVRDRSASPAAVAAVQRSRGLSPKLPPVRRGRRSRDRGRAGSSGDSPAAQPAPSGPTGHPLPSPASSPQPYPAPLHELPAEQLGGTWGPADGNAAPDLLPPSPAAADTGEGEAGMGWGTASSSSSMLGSAAQEAAGSDLAEVGVAMVGDWPFCGPLHNPTFFPDLSRACKHATTPRTMHPLAGMRWCALTSHHLIFIV